MSRESTSFCRGTHFGEVFMAASRSLRFPGSTDKKLLITFDDKGLLSPAREEIYCFRFAFCALFTGSGYVPAFLISELPLVELALTHFIVIDARIK